MTNENASTNVLQINEEQNNEWPFYASATTVEIQQISKQLTPTQLLKAPVRLTLFNQEQPQMVSALLDGGSSHSFISPSIMNKLQLQVAADTKNPISERHNFVITSATGITKSACSITNASFEIGSWKGNHSFIISGAVTKHEMIIGRDFFVKNRVIINHAENSLIIGEKLININTISSIFLKPAFDEMEHFVTDNYEENEKLESMLIQIKRQMAEDKSEIKNLFKSLNSNKIEDSTIVELNTISIEQASSITTIIDEPAKQIQFETPIETKMSTENITKPTITTPPPTVTTQQQASTTTTQQQASTTTMTKNIDPNCGTVCKVKIDTIIHAQSQRLIPIVCNLLSTSPSADIVMFEPILPFPDGCLIARSINLINSETLYCNAINSTNFDITFKQNHALGHLNEAEIAEEQFENNVKQYIPLDISKLVHFTGKTCASVPIHEPTNKEISITTADIINHEMEKRIKQLIVGKSLTKEQCQLLLKVLKKNIDVFQWTQNEVGRTKLVEHTIPTGTHEPIQQRQYPIPSVARDNMKNQVDDMLKNEFIRPSNSAWRSPVMLAKKKKADGSFTYRFCVDLKQINNITTKDSYSLPRISETVDALSGAKYFTTLDIDRAFWQVGVAEDDKNKTAFVMDGKLFEFNVMPFGSMNASSTFQRLMDRVLRGLT